MSVTDRRLGSLRNPASLSYQTERDLSQRIGSLRSQFQELYGPEPEVYVRAPGRAEILGNHTDYNQGYALACAISRSTLVAMRRRADEMIRLRSSAYPQSEGLFNIRQLQKDSKLMWTNYARAVVQELLVAGKNLGGADVLIDSTVPSSGGVSSSAALELALAYGLTGLYGIAADRLEMALLCKRAENGPLVESPCGLLDQAAAAFGQKGKFVLLDFKAHDGAPVGIKVISADLAADGYCLIIAVDPEVKRNLGSSGYPARRKMCEDSLPILSKLLGRELACLRDVSIADYEDNKAALAQRGGNVMRMRVEHIVYENQRVLDGVQALERNEVEKFGGLLNAAGHSALELYGLDEKTPELTLLVEAGRGMQGVLGTRNMGGGFSAITLSLVKNGARASFEEKLSSVYHAHYKRALQFIEFESTQGVEVL